MNPLRAFTEHPATVGESYFGHLLQAATFGLRMVFAGFACLLHGIFPFLFVTTGSDAMKALHEQMSARRAKAQAQASDQVTSQAQTLGQGVTIR